MQYVINKNIFFVFCFLIATSFTFKSNAQSIPFNRLTTDDGLSNNYIYDLLQDQFGFLWFATDDGLNRFDGYQFKVFRNKADNKNSLSDNSVWTITEDRFGKIWMGTKNGFVDCYDPVLDKFTHFQIKSDITKENPITIIFIDSKDSIWIGTYRSGVYKLNPLTGKSVRWYHNPNDSTTISNNYISSIAEDKEGNLWIGTFNGLNKFNHQKFPNIFKHYFHNENNKNSMTNNLIWAITPSNFNEDIIWIGTANGITKLNTQTEVFEQIEIPNPDKLQFGTGTAYVLEELVENDKIIWINSYAGLIRYNASKNIFNRFLNDKDNPLSLVSNQLNNIIKDRSGVLWVATHNGLSYFSEKNVKFNSLLPFEDKNFRIGELGKLNTKAIAQTLDGELWFGTETGLYRLNKYFRIDSNPHLNAKNIWSLAVSGFSYDLWIGTYGHGLFRLNYKTNRVSKINSMDDLIRSSSRDFIKSILVDNKGNTWIGYWGVGLARLNASANKIDYWNHKTNDQLSLSHDDVWVIYQDSEDRIWIGTNGGGLNLFDEQNGGIFYRFSHDPKNKNGISSNSIYSIAESKNNIAANNNTTILWVGTNEGLNKLIINNDKDRLKKSYSDIKITCYTIEDGLADNSIKSIVEDENGNLWLGTSSGISFFDLQNNTFINYSSADGIIGNDFNLLSSLRLSNNLIFMGSTSGLNYFSPDKIVQSKYKPPIVFTDFQIFNKSVNIETNAALTKNIFNTDEITLSHTENVFSFEFSALDYNSTSSIRYLYQMEGFDKEWIDGGSRRFVTYTNLNPGRYTFKVRSTNSDGVWCDNVKSIAITITPPWWQTGWAILLYFVVFVAGVWGIIKFQSNRARLQHELKTREFESYHLKEVEQMKSRFFANLSHEFRTPLLLIKGPLESLLSGKIKDNISGYYKMLLRNTEKLQQLIDQLLELSQLEAETIPLKVDRYNIIDVIKTCYNNLKPLADEKNINFVFSTENESVYAMIDKDKLEKIINNLLSNAFKFTPVSGSIYLNIRGDENIDNKVIISVKDTGIGIPKEYQNKIFDRFYQVDNSSKRNFGGSGIGLALVKELATLHKWEVNVQSTEGEGTEFVLEIPIKNHHSEAPDERVTNIQARSAEQSEFLTPEQLNTSSAISKEKSLILFVEDNEDVRTYVNDLLKSDYSVLLADSGESGIEVTKNDLPDLIISDVMMPGMDGFEFCKRLKSDWKTSHIPVILLTAKVDHQSKLDGLGLGADDYITKPFEQKELLIRVKNLIEQRKLLREKFSKDITITAESASYNKDEKELLEKVSSIIEKYLGDENFNSEMLAKEMFMSRSQLTRKMQSATGQGPGEFIRNYKLSRSAKLILEKKLSITQIALEVGFGSPAQFTRAFQKHFSCLPSEFKQIKP